MAKRKRAAATAKGSKRAKSTGGGKSNTTEYVHTKALPVPKVGGPLPKDIATAAKCPTAYKVRSTKPMPVSVGLGLSPVLCFFPLFFFRQLRTTLHKPYIMFGGSKRANGTHQLSSHLEHSLRSRVISAADTFNGACSSFFLPPEKIILFFFGLFCQPAHIQIGGNCLIRENATTKKNNPGIHGCRCMILQSPIIGSTNTWFTLLLLNPPDNTKNTSKYLNQKGIKLQASHLVPVDKDWQPIPIADILERQAADGSMESEEEEEEDEEESEEEESDSKTTTQKQSTASTTSTSKSNNDSSSSSGSGSGNKSGGKSAGASKAGDLLSQTGPITHWVGRRVKITIGRQRGLDAYVFQYLFILSQHSLLPANNHGSWTRLQCTHLFLFFLYIGTSRAVATVGCNCNMVTLEVLNF